MSKVAPTPPASATAVEQINFTFFDPEQHWCKTCSVFPKTAKEYLLHLHSEEHKGNVKPPEIPWHDHLVKDDMPSHPNAPTKRTPIRGLQVKLTDLCSHQFSLVEMLATACNCF